MASNRTAKFAPNDVYIVITQGSICHIIRDFCEGSIVTIEPTYARPTMHCEDGNGNQSSVEDAQQGNS